MILRHLARKGWSLPLPTRLLRLGIWLRARFNGVSLGVRLIVQDEAGRILLVRHSYVKGWFLPGGGVTPGEAPMQAAKRELLEETGIEALSMPDLFGCYLSNRANIRDYILCYRIAHWRRERDGADLQDGEIAESGFFDLRALPEGISVATQNRLEELMGTRGRADHW